MSANLPAAFEATVSELERLGRLPMELAARVELGRLAVVALESKPTDANLIREVRNLIGELLGFVPEAVDDSDEFLQFLRTPVGDEPEPGT